MTNRIKGVGKKTERGCSVSGASVNRRNTRQTTFRKEADYEAFERILGEGTQRYEIYLFSWQLMPDHWHKICWECNAGQFTQVMDFVTVAMKRVQLGMKIGHLKYFASRRRSHVTF